jgi:hypothetical protein
MNTVMLKTSMFLIAALTAVPALAQPTPAQTSAIKSNCRSDYMKSCMSVPTGGQAAFECLKRNMASLSPACRQAVNAINPPAAPKPAAAAPAPAPAAPAPTPAAVTPPPPPAPAPTVTAAPATAPVVTPASVAVPVATAPAAKPSAKPATAPKPAPAPKPVAAAIAAPPTAAQQNAIRQSCRNDFMANCSGVQPGGKEALVCLQTKASKLSPACRQAVSAIGGAPKPAATAAAVAATPTAPAAAAVEVAPAMPTPEQQAAIKNTCRADFMRNCRGVQPGGPEALMCLQTNSARLSPNCKTSVAAIADSIPSASAAAATAAAAATTTPAAAPAKRKYLTPGIHPAVRIGRRIRERLEENR